MSRRRSFEVSGLEHENPIPMGCTIGPFMMSSGIFGMEPGSRKTPPDVESQCKLMFENIRRVMEAAGGSVEDIIKVVVWAKDKSFKEAVNSRRFLFRKAFECSFLPLTFEDGNVKLIELAVH